MANTIMVNPNILEDILVAVQDVKNEVAEVKSVFNSTVFPAYGSEEWWDLSLKMALRDKERGEIIKYVSTDEYISNLKLRE